MVRQRRQLGGIRGHQDGLEHLGRTAVQRRAPIGVPPAVERLLKEGVGEARQAAVAVGEDELRAHGLVEPGGGQRPVAVPGARQHG